MGRLFGGSVRTYMDIPKNHYRISIWLSCYDCQVEVSTYESWIPNGYVIIYLYIYYLFFFFEIKYLKKDFMKIFWFKDWKLNSNVSFPVSLASISISFTFYLYTWRQSKENDFHQNVCWISATVWSILNGTNFLSFHQ